MIMINFLGDRFTRTVQHVAPRVFGADARPLPSAHSQVNHTKEEHMATRTQTVVIDDLDGSEADETLTFGLDGETYEIDLTEENATVLRELLEPYVGVARRVTNKRGPRARRAARTSEGSGSGSRTAQIRAWAIENGHEVNSRGRLPANIVELYDEAHG